MRYLFETTSPNQPPTSLLGVSLGERLDFEAFNPRGKQNPYHLPWALRGIVEDAHVRELFEQELNVLRDTFDHWNPVSKPLRDVKFKLDPIRQIPKSSNRSVRLGSQDLKR